MPDAFQMMIDDIFVLKNRGLILMGKPISGTLRKGDVVHIIHDDKCILTATVAGLDLFHRAPDSSIGILLLGVAPEQIAKGMILTGDH